jgi:flagellar biosynthetic protein FlhB
MADPAKTERATPRRRQEARERGQVIRSVEINSVVILLMAVLFFRFAGSYVFRHLARSMVFAYQNLSVPFSIQNVYTYGLFYLMTIFQILMPILMVILIVSLLVNYLQIGVLFTVQPLMPKFDNINPISGFKKIFSMRSLAEGVKSILKLIILGWVGYFSVKDALPKLIPTMSMSNIGSLIFVGELTLGVLVKILLAFCVLAALDYAFQRWDYEQSLKMTRQEIRDEFRQTEGNPLMKSRIRQIQREMSRQRMFEAIATADVIITNPTHIAVALKYSKEMSAPTVLAKGERLIAERIKATALANKIPIVENPPLARAIFKSCLVGSQIPNSLFEAVAEVLAFVYRLNQAKVR